MRYGFLAVISILSLLLVACFEKDDGTPITPLDGDAELFLDSDIEPDKADKEPAETEAEPEISEQESTETQTDGDTENDIVDDDPEFEAEPDSQEQETPNACTGIALDDQTFEPFAAWRDTQLHPFLLFDGVGIWLIASIASDDGSGNFETVMTRFSGTGETLVAPFKVNTTAKKNSIDPVLAQVGDKLLAAWQTYDNDDNAMDIYYRLFELDGTPVSDTDQSLEPKRQNLAVVGNLSTPILASDPLMQRFVMAGLWGLEGVNPFQAFVQIFDRQGALVGNGLDVNYDPQAAQLNPAVAVGMNGATYLAWNESPMDNLDLDQVRFSRIPASSVAAETPKTLCSYCTYPFLSASKTDREAVYLAVDKTVGTGGTQSDIALWSKSALEGDGKISLVLGEGGGMDVGGVVAAGDAGGAVLWHRVRSGIKGDAYFQRFSDRNGTLSALNAPITLNSGDDVTYFSPALARVCGDTYVASWAEGASPHFLLKAAVIRGSR